MLKKISTMIIIVSLLICCGKKTEKKGEVSGSQADTQPVIQQVEKIYNVRVSTVEPQNIKDFIQVTGATFPDKRVNLASFSGGLVEKIYFDEGQYVNEGDTVAEIDLQLYYIKLNKFLAEFENVKANYEKDNQLYQSKAIPKIKFIESKSKYESMIQDIEQIKVYIDRAIIKAPYSGFIVKKFVEPGEIIPQGQTVFTLNKMDVLRVKFELPSKDIGFFKENQTNLIISFDAYPEDVIYGKINVISKDIISQNMTYEAETLIQNKNYKYKAGLLTRVKVLKQSIANNVVITKNAVIDYEDGSKVFVLNDSGTVSLRNVKLGAMENDKVQIIEGLDLNEKIVVEGQKDLYDSAKVKVVE
ncbi:MAG TPA: efflux RND transporter periplasmic adaptor subunit [bacterium]|nr:efflux RND transporter periplasmic adaptor subunit [bacterium]HPN30380.1 efflux RND transporter periplasmic adaptor subunit [bacterium]